jgi:3-methylcrotonyl-CoA carboxylase beta subunit
MGGEQAAQVLATVKRDAFEARGTPWPEQEQRTFTDEIRATYETQGHPYYASARLWDDGVIDPLDTRRVLGLAIAAAAHGPAPGDERYGIFRM